MFRKYCCSLHSTRGQLQGIGLPGDKPITYYLWRLLWCAPNDGCPATPCLSARECQCRAVLTVKPHKLLHIPSVIIELLNTLLSETESSCSAEERREELSPLFNTVFVLEARCHHGPVKSETPSLSQATKVPLINQMFSTNPNSLRLFQHWNNVELSYRFICV